MRAFLPILPLIFACNSEEAVKIYNSEPTATITSHTDGEQLLEAMEYTFIGQVSDGNHTNAELKVIWSTDTQELCPESNPDANGETSCLATLTPSDTKLKLQVTDPEGAAYLTSITIDVQETDAPTISLISPTADGSYYSDQLIHFSAIIQDTEDEPQDLTYTWESSQDGELNLNSSPDSDGSISGYTTLTQGQHAITLRVEDTTGKITSEDVAIIVGGPNNEPLCTITSPEADSGFVFGQNISFSGTATDEDINNALLTVSWESNIDGVFETSAPITDGSLAFTTDQLSIGNHSITLKVEDEVGGLCTDAVQIAVGTPPTLTITSPAPGDVITLGESVAFAGTVEDQEDIPSDISITWVSDIDGTFSTQGSDSSGTIAFGFSDLSAGQHNLSITATDSDGLTAIVAQSLRINTPPSAPTLSITPDPAFTTNDLVVTATGATDADGDTITYTYEWYTDGTLTSYTTNTIPASATSVGEQWYVRVTSNDGYTDGGFAEIATYVINSAPTISAVSITPNTSIYNDSVLTCSATASDADETVNPTYEWSVGSNTYSGATLDLSSTAAMPTDTITCTASVEDSNGASTSSSDSVVVENRNPNVSGLVLSPTLVYSNTEISCTGTTSDDDGETPTTTVEWSVGSNNIGSGDTITLDSSMVSVGDTLTCTFTAEDGFGGTASDMVTTTILNTDPTIDSVTLTPTTPNKHATLLCEATTSDVDGDTPTLSFAWSNLTTSDVYTSTNSTSDSAELDLGTLSTISPEDVVECVVTATDIDGGSSTHIETAEIVNSAPVFDATAAITPNTGVYTNTVLTCSATVTDPDDGALTPSYEWFNGTASLGSGDTYTVSASNSNVGDSLTCIATATDSDGETVTSSASVIVENTDPVLSGISITPNSAYNDDTLTCSATVTDPDETLTIDYAWSAGSNSLSTGSSIDLSMYTINPTDVVTCTASVSDSEGSSDSATDTVTIDNRAPTIDAVSIDNTTPYSDSTITCSATVTDSDGESITPTYEWTIGSNVVGSSAALPLTPTMASVGDTVTCTVSVSDAYGGSDSTTATATVQNTDPTMGTVSISPSTATVTELLTCSASGTDLNDGALTATYAWTNDTTVSTLGSSATLQLDSTISSPDDIITCTVTFTDNDAASVSDSASVTITNTAPVFDVAAAISPSGGVYTGTELTCSSTASDADDGSIAPTYEWTVGTNTVSSTDTYTVSASDTNVGDSITCTATATDSDGETITSSDSVTVENTDPVLSGTTIDLSTIYNDDTVVCSSSVTDPDESLSISYEWTLDSVVVGSTDTLDLSTTAAMPQDTLVCTASVSDSDGGSDSETANTTIANRAPSAPTISISPTAPSAGQDDLVCSVDIDSVDNDGDSILYTYVWSNNSGIVQQTTEVTATFDIFAGSGTSEGTWMCEVTAFDSINYSHSEATIVTVSSFIEPIPISLGDVHTCAINISQGIECWGDDYYGQSSPPTGTFTQVAAGGYHTCGITTGETVECWGYNSAGPSSPPTGTFTEVAAGGYHTCGITTGETVECWGDDYYGQSSPPTYMYTTLTLGDYHTCGITTSGNVECWGYNHYGQSSPPTGTFTEVAAGGYHTCGITTGETVECWGYNHYGQSSPPTGTFTHLTSGLHHTCGITTSGTVECWGYDHWGQSSPPTGTFTEVAAGGYHTCGITTGETVECWGYNSAGQSSPPSGITIF